MRPFIVVTACLAVTVCAPVELRAKQLFALYDGPDAVKVGSGGTRVDKNGIQYWTQGAPVRPFRVLGIFDDSRKDRWWDGDAIGSKSIAKKVAELGADAVIVLDKNTKLSSINTLSEYSYNGSFGGTANSFGGFGSFGGSYSGSGSGFSTTFAINRVTTRLLVVHYLTENELSELKEEVAKAASAEGVLPQALRTSAASAGQDYGSNGDGPRRRPAKTPSGYCLDVPRGYAGTGSLNRPAITSAAPACWSVVQ